MVFTETWNTDGRYQTLAECQTGSARNVEVGQTIFRHKGSTKSRMNLRHAAALALVGWYLMVPSRSCTAGSSAGSVDVKAARVYAAGENSEAPGAQGSGGSQLRDEIEHEWYVIDHEWYVMCPPFATKPLGVAVSAPFTQWDLETRYPNREMCEKRRAAAARMLTEEFPTPAKETLRATVTKMQHCRCFSSNDPRLDQKFVRRIKDFYLLATLSRRGLLKMPPKLPK